MGGVCSIYFVTKKKSAVPPLSLAVTVRRTTGSCSTVLPWRKQQKTIYTVNPCNRKNEYSEYVAKIASFFLNAASIFTESETFIAHLDTVLPYSS